jgi:PKD repeat protein
MRVPGRIVLVLLMLGGFLLPGANLPAKAAPDCKKILLVFARGSSQGFDKKEATTFFDAIRENVDPDARSGIGKVELGRDGTGDYPAVGLKDWFGVDLPALFDPESDAALGGYNASRKKGTKALTQFLNARNCPGETVILGGYSQGADVIGAALKDLTPRTTGRIGYVALFGDPEFNGLKSGGLLSFPQKASWVRGDAPWYLASGVLGARNPYVPRAYEEITGSWCDRWDPVCTGAPLLPTAHEKYPDKEIPEAANEIVVKLKLNHPQLADDLHVTPLPIAIRPSSKVDVAFVVDTTGSMGDDIAAAQDSIKSITTAVFGLAKSPRVSLVDYKDAGDLYQSRVDSAFTADRTAFANAVNSLSAAGGGDTPESAYSGLMTSFGLNWRPGAVKLAILIGDAPAKDPEPVTGYTLAQVLKKAFELDPVVIDPIVIGGDAAARTSFAKLAEGSKGKLFDASNSTEVVGAIDEAIKSFSLAPVALADGPYTAAPGQPVRFTGAASYDPDSAIREYLWDFNNDGKIDARGSSSVAFHTFTKTYTGLASLTVKSFDGGTATGTATVNVAPGRHRPRPPGAPRSVTAKLTSAGTVTLSWRPPAFKGDGAVGGYRLYRQDGTLIALIPAKKHSIAIRRVPAGRSERFSIEALNAYGAGPRATSNTVRTSGTTAPSTQPGASTTTGPATGPTHDQPTPQNHGGLPFTGDRIAQITAIAALLLALGGGTVLIARKRRRKVEMADHSPTETS